MIHHKTAAAVLYNDQGYLLQLRDPLPHVIGGGMFALFGGHIEEGEDPEIALKREIKEELGFFPDEIFFFEKIPFTINHKGEEHYYEQWVFLVPFVLRLDQLSLQEGSGFALLPYSSLHTFPLFENAKEILEKVEAYRQKNKAKKK